MSLVSQFEFQAQACAKLGSPFYGALLPLIAADIDSDGPCAAALTDYTDAPWEAALPLRLPAAVHALVLSGAAPDLAPFYPSAGAAAAPDPADIDAESVVWKAFRAVVAAHPDRIADWLTRPPQTNEVGRAVPLLTGLLAAVDAQPLPVRLLELGSSAGLNLRADRYHWYSNDFEWGPPDSPVSIGPAWRGAMPDWLVAAARRHPRVTVVERRGCDPAPLDPRSPSDTLALRSYLWPDQVDRAARLNGALEVAALIPAEITPRGAAEFLRDIGLERGTLTLVWHSVMRQYVPGEEWAAVNDELNRLAAAASPDVGFAYVAFEPGRDAHGGFELTVRIGRESPRVLAHAVPHGVPAFS
jgi:hypothetical protein